MNKDSRELEEAINRFAKEFQKLSQPKDQEERNVKWQRLFKSGAPKALGDVFLAVIDAVAMDSDYFEAEQLMLQHYQDSERIFDIMKDREVPAGIPNHTLMSTNGLQHLREDFRRYTARGSLRRLRYSSIPYRKSWQVVLTGMPGFT